MRAFFGVISLLIALLAVVALSKKQWCSIASAPIPKQQSDVADRSPADPTTSDRATPQLKAQQIDQQIKLLLDANAQQTRSIADEAK